MPATYDYTRTPLDGDYDIDHKDLPSVRLARDVATAFPGQASCVRITGTAVSVVFTGDTPPAKVDVDPVVASHIATTTSDALDGVKQVTVAEVAQAFDDCVGDMTWNWSGDATKDLPLSNEFRGVVATLQTGAAGLAFPITLPADGGTSTIAVANAAALLTVANELAAAFYIAYAAATTAQQNVMAAANYAAVEAAADAYISTL